jgi:hypothetical protein|tara:strand:+ start:446 stop:652 length:207 start_codon:yes stop_codon:yes gene_type:complete
MKKNTRKKHNRKQSKQKSQKGGSSGWGAFAFGSLFGALINQWLSGSYRTKNQSGGKTNKNKKTRRNKK